MWSAGERENSIANTRSSQDPARVQRVGGVPVPSRCCWHGWKYSDAARYRPVQDGERVEMVAAGHRGRLWPCGETHLGSAVDSGRWRGSPAGSRMCRSQEPSGLIEGGRTRTGRPKEEERNIASSKRTVPIRAGGLGHPGAIRHPATSPHSSVATQSTVIPHAGAAWWSWSCERTERKRFFSLTKSW